MTPKTHIIDCGRKHFVRAIHHEGRWWLSSPDVCRLLNIGYKEGNKEGFSVVRLGIRVAEGSTAFMKMPGPSRGGSSMINMIWVNIDSVHRIEIHASAWKKSNLNRWHKALNNKIRPYIDAQVATEKPLVEMDKPEPRVIDSAPESLKVGLSIVKEAIHEVISESRELRSLIEKMNLDRPMTVMRWAAIYDVDLDASFRTKIGIRASKLCKERSIPVEKVETFGYTPVAPKVPKKLNAYPAFIIEEAVAQILAE